MAGDWLERAEEVPEQPAPATPAAAEPVSSPATWRSRAVDVDVDAQQRRAANLERTRVMFAASLDTPIEDHAAIAELTRQSRLPAEDVEKNLPALRKSWQAAQHDPAKWAEQNPELYRLFLEHPEAGKIVLRDVTPSRLVDGLVGYFGGETKYPQFMSFGTSGAPELADLSTEKNALGTVRARLMAIPVNPAEDAATDRARLVMGLEKDLTGAMAAWPALDGAGDAYAARTQLTAAIDRRLQEIHVEEERRLTRKVAGVEESKEGFTAWQKIFGKDDQSGVLGSSWKQGALVVDRAKLGNEWTLRVLAGEDTWDVDKQVLDVENRMIPHFYGSGELTAILQATGELAPAQVRSYAGGGVGAGLGGTVGAIVGKVTGLGVKRGAVFGARAGGTAGLWLATFQLEQGNAALDFRNLKTDDGKPVSPEVAIGWSIVYGTISATIETGSEFSKLGSWGPLGELARKGSLKEAGKRLLRDPSFRKLLVRVARGYAGNIAKEAGEEGLQQLTQEALGYIARSQEAGSLQEPDVASSVESVVDSVKQAAVGSIIPGAAGPIVDLTTQTIHQQRARRGQQQLKAVIDNAKDSPLAQGHPDAYARLVELATEKTGEKVSAMYVDPAAFTALFQDEAEAAAAARELMGEDGPRRLQEAIATGTKLEVPIAEFADKWRGKPIADQLVDHVSAKPFLPTAAEDAAQAKAREAEAQQVLAAIDEGTAPPSPAEAPLEQLSQDLVQAGRVKAEERAADVKLWRKTLNAFAIRSGVPLENLVQQFVVRVQSEQQAQPAAAAAQLEQPGPTEKALREGYAAMAPEAQQRRFFLDSNTQLFNERAWKRLPADPARPLVVHLSVEGTKWANKVSHSHGNRLYALVGRALARVVGQDALPAKVGGDFAFLAKDAGEAHAAAELVREAIREELRAANPDMQGLEGLDVSVETAPRGENALASWRDAGKRHGAAKDAREASGARAGRGARPRGVPVADAAGLAIPGGAAEEFAIPAELQKIDVRTPAAAGEVLTDERTGLLSYDGFFSLPKKAFVAAVDLNGLKALNKRFGEAFGDAFLAEFAAAVRRSNGQAFDAAHLSGDEYAFQADDRVLLQGYIDLLAEVCEDVGVPGQDGGITFGYGIADDYDAADKLVEPHKQRGVAAEREARAGRSRDRRGAGLQEGRAPDAGGVRGAVQEGVGRGDRPGEGEARPAVTVPSTFWAAVRVHEREQLAALRAQHGDEVVSLPEYQKAEENLRRAEAALAAERDQLDQSSGGGPRGWTTRIREGLRSAFRVILTEKADPSTFLHESGHVFMDILGELASREGAPAQLVADWQSTLAFVGAKDLAELQDRRDRAAAIRRAAADAGRELTQAERDQVRELVAPFEKWARGFERYLAEGKAPSLELAGAFQRFKLWLREIYRDVAALGVELNDEIRGVFDRMIATDEEIARARQQMGPTQLFRSPEEAGLQDKPEEWAAYLERAEKAVSAATQAAQQRAAAARLAATESWWKEARAGRLDDALQEYDTLPAVVALRFLRKGDPSRNAALAALGRVKLDEATVKAILSEEELKRFRGLLQRFDPKTGEGGMNPDHLAELVAPGQDLAGEDLVRQMVHLEPRSSWAAARADEQMARDFPDVQTEREQLRDAASRALHGDAMLTWFLHEQQVLRQRLAEATGKKLQELGAGAAGVPAESVRRAAELLVDRMRLERLDQGFYERAERQAAERAATAAAKGDFGTALVELQRRLLNFFAVRELQRAREVRDGLAELGRDLGKDRTRARIGKGSRAIRDGLDQVLEALGLAGPFPSPGAQRASLAEAVQAVEDSGVTVMFDAAELEQLVAQPPDVKARRGGEPGERWRGLTVAQASNVLAALKNLRKAASSNLTALVDGKRVDFEELRDRLVEEASQNLPDRGPPASSVQAETLLQVVGGVVSGIDGELLRPETMLDWLGGKAGVESWWYRAVVKPLQDGKHREADLLRETIAPVVKAMERIPAAVKRRMREKVDGRALFPDHTEAIEAPTRRYELVALALNAGNASNLERLLGGRNITRDQLMRALGLLTREELEYVQTVWDAAESLWPLARDLEERLSGLAPEQIAPRPLTVPLSNGEQVSLRGGYFPAVYDRRVEVKGELQATDVRRGVDFLDPGFVRPGTAHSHLKGRVEGTVGVISLDPTIIQSHLVQVAHDIAFREAVLSVGRLFLDQQIQATLRRRLGEKRAAIFLDWVKDVGRSRAAQAVSQARTMTRIANRLRSNMAVGALGYAADIVAGDLTNPAVAAVKFKNPKHLIAAIAESVSRPMETRRWALEKSGELRTRADELLRHFKSNRNELTKRQFPGRKVLDAYVDHAFDLFEWSDALTATPIWVGAYREGLALFENADAKAVEYADKMVRDFFPPQSVVDQSAIQRDKGFWGSAMLFFGYFNTIYNRRRDIAHDAFVVFSDPASTGAQRAGAVARVAWKWIAVVAAYQILGEFLSGRGKEPDEDWDEWLLRKAIAGLTVGDLPFGALAEPAISKVVTGKSKRISARAAPAIAVVQGAADSLTRALDGKGDAKEFFEIVRSLGLLLGLPTRPLRSAEYLVDEAGDDLERGRINEIPAGLIYGERKNQPANPFAPGGPK